MDVAFTPLSAPPIASAEDRWLPCRAGQVLLVDDFAEGPRPLSADEADQLTEHMAEPLVLGRLHDEQGHWWTALVADDFDPFDAPFPGLMFSDLRSMMAKLDPMIWNIAGRAHADHRTGIETTAIAAAAADLWTWPTATVR